MDILNRETSVKYDTYMNWNSLIDPENYFVELYKKQKNPTDYDVQMVVKGYEEKYGKSFISDYANWCRENGLKLCEHGNPIKSDCPYCKWGTD